MSINVELEMTPALRSKLSTLTAALGPAAMNPALMAGGWLIANDAKGRAAYKSGTLRRSIEPQERGPGDVVVGSSVPYARRIEYGFMQADRLGRRYNQAAQPYLRPAFDAQQAAVRAAIIAGAQAVIRRALGA
jgi:hypothetical protein